MELKHVKPGSDYAYFCRKNKVICHVPASCDDDGACLIIETVLADGEIMGPLLYSEACYLTPVTDLSTRCDKAYLMDLDPTQLADLIECCCMVQEVEPPAPSIPSKDWELVDGEIKVNADPHNLFAKFVYLNQHDLIAMMEKIQNES